MEPVLRDPFAQLSDYLEPEYQNEKKSVYWGRFAETIEKFDQIMLIERKEIRQSVNEIFRKKAQLLRKMVDFKSSVRNQGENRPVDTLLMENEKLHKFFQREQKEIAELIRMFVARPQDLSALLLKYEDKKKFNFSDFTLNIVNLFYTYYSMEERPDESSEFYRFLLAVMRDWNYDAETYRLRYHAIHNDMVLAFFKTPQAECFIEKMAARFIQELDQPQPFVFDLSMIQAEVESKKLAMKSFVQPEKKSFFKSLRDTFTGSKTDQNVKYQSTEQQSQYAKQALIIQRARQERFISVLRKSLEIILSEQLPYSCKLVLRAFKDKLEREVKRQPNTKLDINRHFCCLLLTNWILSEFHYKFTMSHDEKATMTNVELQNVSQVLKAITLVFQCSQPLDKNLFYRQVVGEYKVRIENYYERNLDVGTCSARLSHMGSLMVRYEHSLRIFSFNDIKIFCDLVRTGKLHGFEFQGLSQQALGLEYAQSKMYLSKSRVNFRKHDYDAQNIYFMLKIDQEVVLQEISEHYLGREYPLNQLPILTEKLLKSSNLSVESSLELSKSLQFMKKLNSKQILRNLQRLEENFKTLKVHYIGYPQINETKVINDIFTASFHRKIKDNLIRKCELSRRKNNLCLQMDAVMSYIDLYKNKYKSDMFYHNVTCKFISLLQIKVYVGIDDGRLQVHKEPPETDKRLQISNIIMARATVKERPQAVVNSILENSFKQFTSVEKVIQAVAQVDICRKAFTHGRKTQQFNEFFNSFCSIVGEKIGQFISEKKYLQHLNQQKFRGLLQDKIGQLLLKHLRLYEQIERDKNLCQRFQLLDPQVFYQRELAHLNLQTFLFDQVSISFNEIDNKPNARSKIEQFDALVKQIFSIISLTMSRDKITAEIITPIIQYVLLKSQPKNCFKNLYIVECLLGVYTHETAYLMTSWTAAVTYLNSLGQEASRMSTSSIPTTNNSGLSFLNMNSSLPPAE